MNLFGTPSGGMPLDSRSRRNRYPRGTQHAEPRYELRGAALEST